MKDIVERLRGYKESPRHAEELCAESADEIERLRKDAERGRWLIKQAVYEGSSDWTIEVWGRFASIEEAIDAAMANGVK